MITLIIIRIPVNLNRSNRFVSSLLKLCTIITDFTFNHFNGYFNYLNDILLIDLIILILNGLKPYRTPINRLMIASIIF